MMMGLLCSDDRKKTRSISSQYQEAGDEEDIIGSAGHSRDSIGGP